jgi:predicted metalloprotease
MKKNIAGAAALPSILLLSGIIAEIILAVIVVAGLFSRSGFGARLSAEATAAAYAGAEDGIYRILRGDSTVLVSLYSYSIFFNPEQTRSAEVTIRRIEGCSSSVAFCDYSIASEGKAFLSNRKVEAVLSVDPLTRQIEVRSFKEIEVSAP